MHHGSKYERGPGPSEQIQHVVQINFFPDAELAVRLRQVIEQELQNQGASEPAAFDFEIGKAHRQVCILNVRNSNEAGIFHGAGKAGISLQRVLLGRLPRPQSLLRSRQPPQLRLGHP